MGTKSKNKRKTLADTRIWVVKVIGEELYVPVGRFAQFSNFPTKFYARLADAKQAVTSWTQHIARYPKSIVNDKVKIIDNGLEIIEFELKEVTRINMLPSMTHKILQEKHE